MIPYCNNLRAGDVVLNIETKRNGTVAKDPRDDARTVLVKLDGTNSAIRFHVLKLRLIVDGKPEECPPISGDPGEPDPEQPKISRSSDDPIPVLKATRDGIAKHMEAIEGEFKGLKERRDRLDKAIAALES